MRFIGILPSAFLLKVMAMSSSVYAQTADNRASVAVPTGAIETLATNNSAIDSDTIFADIVATNDSETNVDGLAGDPSVLNVFDGDTINGVNAGLGNVILRLPTGETVPAGLTFNPATGVVGVDPNTPAGTLSFQYEICEIANPTNCRTATVS